MISERTFAVRYTSFWHQALPMGEEVIEAINNNLKREFSRSRPQPDREARHDLISEISLRWFAARILEGRLSKRRPSPSTIEKLVAEACTFVGRLHGAP